MSSRGAEPVAAAAQQTTDTVERVAGPAAVPEGLLLDRSPGFLTVRLPALSAALVTHAPPLMLALERRPAEPTAPTTFLQVR